MIGDDIVDLKIAESQSNWKRKGFLNKVFLESEKHYIATSDAPFEMVWRLWTMKESAYKAYVQKNKKRFFAPKKLGCKIIDNQKGEVVIHGSKYETLSYQSTSVIHTVAIETNGLSSKLEHFKLTSSNSKIQHIETRNRFLKEMFNKGYGNQLEIRKNDIGVPLLYDQENMLHIPFSLSHHGNYGAYSYLN